jgi:RHS repeat-associated protein
MIVAAYRYGYNDAGQRVTLQMPDGSGWRYQYDPLGQLVMGRRYWPDGTAVAGQQFEYGFDDIGNRKGKALLGGDANGANLRESTYTLKANGLNQYDTRTVPAYVDILGAAYGTVAPTVNGLTVDARKGEYFWKQLSVPNSTAKWQSVSVNVPGGTAQTGNVLVPPATQSFSYDTDGNLLGDGLWDYTWDAENRLIQMITPTTAYNAGVPGVKLTFEYDDQGRRIAKRRYNSTTSLPAAASYPGSPNATLKFLYDGWNVLAELDGSNQQVRTYLWGNDLSGSPQGAGGVGGLLKITQYTWGGNPNPALKHHFVAYDGNGNVTGLVDGATGVTTATYEFGPFGELLRANGTLAKANPFRFSTKYTDDETDLLYYGYRFYSPSLGRWINRDPSEEHGNDSLYSFVGNDPTTKTDHLGLCVTEAHDAFYLDWKQEIESSFNVTFNIQNWQHVGFGSAFVDGALVDDHISYNVGDLFWRYSFIHAQSGDLAFQHAMRDKRTTKEASRQMYRNFLDDIKRSINSTINDIERPGCLDRSIGLNQALFSLGMAAHAVSDNTSPAHYDFQEWISPYHALFSFGIPGTGIAATSLAYVHQSKETQGHFRKPSFLNG